ncbi:hypothetical protein AWZ03_011030 [Drosophila navojoa]|uniref:Uncharacterized protein n=1 Tax=Drosophila navojoa TaxID=7232 RepID=A0A484B3A3_DRONA|nr:hypothetical protein AWZ03_011030 [Drosophila navojoa]
MQSKLSTMFSIRTTTNDSSSNNNASNNWANNNNNNNCNNGEATAKVPVRTLRPNVRSNRGNNNYEDSNNNNMDEDNKSEDIIKLNAGLCGLSIIAHLKVKCLSSPQTQPWSRIPASLHVPNGATETKMETTPELELKLKLKLELEFRRGWGWRQQIVASCQRQ